MKTKFDDLHGGERIAHLVFHPREIDGPRMELRSSFLPDSLKVLVSNFAQSDEMCL